VLLHCASFVLCGYATWSVTLRREIGFTAVMAPCAPWHVACEAAGLRALLGGGGRGGGDAFFLGRGEVTGDWRKINDEELLPVYMACLVHYIQFDN